MLPDTTRHIIRNNFNKLFKIVDAKPMDISRVLVSLSDVEDNLYNLNQKITGLPPLFIFNLDDVGYEEFADSHEIKVIVPFNYRGNSAPYIQFKGEREILYWFVFQQTDLIVFHNLL